jgi:hypothetical protein
MPQDKKRKGPSPKPPSVGQLKTELAALRTRVDELRVTVNKLKDILQVEDNWHSHVSKMIGKPVIITPDIDIGDIHGTLRWTDRYTVGIDVGEELIVNKGHIAFIKLA